MSTRKGYLYKQGAYFGAWNDRYFSLEGSLLKQFSDSETPFPSYTIFLGSAVVDGIFTPASNEEAGHGVIYSFVLRWPIPGEALEQSWGYMHLGSYEEGDLQEWFNQIKAMTNRKKIDVDDELRKETKLPVTAPKGFTNKNYTEFASLFNYPMDAWSLQNAQDGLLYRMIDDPGYWRFNIRVSADPKTVWETLLLPEANRWEPTIKTVTVTECEFPEGVWTLHEHFSPEATVWERTFATHEMSYHRNACQEGWIVMATSPLTSFSLVPWIGWTVYEDVGNGWSIICCIFPSTLALTRPVIDYVRKMKEFLKR